jgi:hypothetical protein
MGKKGINSRRNAHLASFPAISKLGFYSAILTIQRRLPRSAPPCHMLTI